jgi:hypothetical protein
VPYGTRLWRIFYLTGDGSMAKHLNVYVVEEFEAGGEQRKNYTQVGKLFPHSKGEGFNLLIQPGIAISGELVAFPPKPKDDNPDA